jgi:poly(3-hydroxybutyrate) depolymerase
MKRISVLLSVCFLGLLCTLPASAKDKDKVQTIHLQFNGKDRTYLLLVPNSAAPTALLTAVMLVHAQGGWASDVMGMWKGKASREGFMLVAPESSSNTMWDSRYDGPDYLHAVLEDANRKHPIDPTKIFMFGDDTGGIYAYEIGIYDSQNWGAVCAEHAIVSSDAYNLFPHAQRKIAFQDWVGDKDDDHPLRTMALEHDAFTKAGFPFDLKIIQNSSGSYGNVYDQVNDGCYNFFVKNPLPAPAPDLAEQAPAAAAPASK